jgi:hypothetical protein
VYPLLIGSRCVSPRAPYMLNGGLMSALLLFVLTNRRIRDLRS